MEVQEINMIEREQFIKKFESFAQEYAHEIICDEEEHYDAIKAVMTDFLEGAITAYDYLKEHDN